MEAPEEQLPESGVQDHMNLKEMGVSELKKAVCTLENRKLKNEENVPADLLNSKYAKAYESLCEELKFTRGELVARYVRMTRKLYETMSDDAYDQITLPETQEPLFWAFYLTFRSYLNGDWDSYMDVLKLYEKYNDILLEDDPAWKDLTEQAEAMIRDPGCTELKEKLTLYTVAELERMAEKRRGRS